MTETKRPRVPISDVKIGTVLFTDDGFTCMGPGRMRTVYRDEHGLFVTCDDGRHYLDGQLLSEGPEELADGEEDAYVGFRLG